MFAFGGKIVGTSIGFGVPYQLHDLRAAVQYLNNLLVYSVDLFAPFGQAHRAVIPSVIQVRGASRQLAARFDAAQKRFYCSARNSCKKQGGCEEHSIQFGLLLCQFGEV